MTCGFCGVTCLGDSLFVDFGERVGDFCACGGGFTIFGSTGESNRFGICGRCKAGDIAFGSTLGRISFMIGESIALCVGRCRTGDLVSIFWIFSFPSLVFMILAACSVAVDGRMLEGDVGSPLASVYSTGRSAFTTTGCRTPKKGIEASVGSVGCVSCDV